MKNFLSHQRLSLRTQIVLPYIFLALLLAVGVAYIGIQIISDSIEERFTNQLIEAGKVASEWMVREENRLLEAVRFLAYAEGLAEALKAEDAETLRRLALPIAVNSQQETVELLNRQGIAVLSMHHRPGGQIEEYDFSRGSDTFQQWPIVQKILAGDADPYGDKYAGLMQNRRRDYLYIAGPIFDSEGQRIGIVLVGESVESLVRKIREQILAQATIYSFDGQSIATTFLDSPTLDPDVATTLVIRSSQTSLIRDISVSGIAYSELLGSWQVRKNDVGIIGVSFAKNFLVRLSQSRWAQVLGTTLIGFLLVIVVGLSISEHISRPILKLEQAASQVADGNLQVQLTPTGNDEVTRLTEQFNNMVANLYRSKSDLLAAYDVTLAGWVKALELRDRDTEGHSQRVTELVLRLAKAMNVEEEKLEVIRHGALLHDIGKMAIPDEILLKPGPLTDEEMAIMRQHPVYAARMLENIPFLKSAMDIPLTHHERWDGLGYPRGLKGEEIPLAGRMFAIVDVWDSVRSARPYRALPLSEAAARELIQAGRGRHFDPQVVDAFLKIIEELSQEQASDEIPRK